MWFMARARSGLNHQVNGDGHRVVHTRAGSSLFLAIVFAHVAIGIAIKEDDLTARLPLTATVVNWTVVGLLAALLVVRRLRHAVGVLVALICDLLPLLVLGSAGVVVAAVVEQQWPLVVEAAILTGAGVAAFVPRLVATEAPTWTADAPEFVVASANVFAGNRTPLRTAAVLLATDADVIVMNEASDDFMANFDAIGGATHMPFRVVDRGAATEYRTVIASRRPLMAGSGVVVVGGLRMAQARVEVGSAPVTVLGIHLRAAVERHGHSRWLAETLTLADVVRDAEARVMIAGDFNGTLDRPQLRELLRQGFVDAHESLGRGLQPSLQPAARGPLSRIAVLRVDHLLTGPGSQAVAVRDVRMPGSDHRALVATVAVVQRARCSSSASSSGSASGP
jgi:endonuclease/exonuclease/phosphatase (EEP) superfamily protein YafD